jgi:glucosamine-6-phosphate deaminase
MDLKQMLSLPTDEVVRQSPVKVTVFKDGDSFYAGLARHMADTVIRNNQAGKKTVMIVPVGPTRQYPIFAEIVNREGIDCSLFYSFNMDEYLDWKGQTIPETHPLSFRSVMRAMLYERIDKKYRMPAEHLVFPDPRCPEVYDDKLHELGGADVCYAGVGYHGHVAFNEPIISRWYKVPEKDFLEAGTHIISIADDTYVINSVREAGGNCEAFPPFAVTVGMKDIMAAREIVGVFYCGSWQRTPFRRTLFQDPTIEYPGTFLKRHANFQVYIDADTAAPVEMRPY